MKFSNWLQQRKEPEKIEEIQCPDCGENATYYYYGIGHGGNADEKTICDNPKCPSNYPKWPGMNP